MYFYLESQVLHINRKTASQEMALEKYHQFLHNQYFFLRKL